MAKPELHFGFLGVLICLLVTIIVTGQIKVLFSFYKSCF